VKEGENETIAEQDQEEEDQEEEDQEEEEEIASFEVAGGAEKNLSKNTSYFSFSSFEISLY
jgi:hypothetical protein